MTRLEALRAKRDAMLKLSKAFEAAGAYISEIDVDNITSDKTADVSRRIEEVNRSMELMETALIADENGEEGNHIEAAGFYIGKMETGLKEIVSISK